MNLIYYKVIVHWPDPAGEFMLAIHIRENKITFYSSSNIQNPLTTIDINNLDSPIPCILNFHRKPIAISLYKAIQALRSKNFPEGIVHANCAVNIIMEKVPN